jgi:tetraacyldisaccharide 4'-kinase
LYGAAARWRRRWYTADRSRQRRLEHPVVSVGNLSVGGSGKTPIVACIATLLMARGERPVVLSRGYARTAPTGEVTVVSDADGVRASLERAGDEPLMLARTLPGIPVVVARDRYAAGRLAEQRLGASVHVLDDGFQHLTLARDVDLLIAGAADLRDRVLPAGRLREPLSAACVADAVLVSDAPQDAEPDAVGRALGVATSFRITRTLGTPRWLASGEAANVGRRNPVVALAGIARPERFFADLEAAGFQVVARQAFRDHHPYTDADVSRIVAAAKRAGTAIVMTTEKDAVRLTDRNFEALKVAVVPLAVTIEPAFEQWLIARLASARERRDNPLAARSESRSPEPRAPSPDR